MCAKRISTPEEREAYNAYMRRYMLARYHSRRALAIERLGGKCVDCGSKKDLELDHADRTTKTYNLGKILSGGSEARVQAELAKCVVRCGERHRKKTAEELDWDRHGTFNGYKRRGCRCEACVEAFRMKSREYKAKYLERKKQGLVGT